MTWLITGGAGYIGAHVVRAMTGTGERVVVLDDFSTGVRERLAPEVPVVRGSVSDEGLLKRLCLEHGVTGVVHLAAHKQVGESVEQPLRYYRDNIGGLAALLEAVAAAGITRFVFSSSAAVYGNPDVNLITEDTPCAPMNPYGETKLAGEWLVRAAGRAHGIRTACLRYFNVAGAAEPRLADTGVSNVIPMVFDRLTRGEAPRIFGADYPTPDGSCVRDYIHVADLADAHLAAARLLAGTGAGDAPGADLSRGAHGADGGGDLTVNIGRGEGVSVRELIGLIGEVTGDTRPALVEARRPGDAPRAVAAADRAAEVLGWRARRGVREMVESAWQGWLQHHPQAAAR
ncbi:UDP-glucose 4-epimerase GalE [Streptomyces sulfonofaciens]|uniref:UDP-glucose 4-epimerase n=1 Tax=Streptomyces sulfonofaciens TaxID=68272 RepID=A0A919L3I9_9ACTN|nr:NAD-dependent epimerase/dehydratase family protein [Streptomyces sulfonofaciens]GHH82603.1 UDP-glucose 4-epimerase GalE [Streptomyces sulfonofaciens]